MLRAPQRPFILLCITLVTVAFLAGRTIDRELRYYDDGVYLINAKSIALGLGYRNLSLPDDPPQGKYPPLFPSLLSIVWRLFPDFPENLPIMKFLILTMGMCFLFVTYVYLRNIQGLEELDSVAIVSMVGLHPLFLQLSTQIMSDIPYALLSILAIYFYSRFLISERRSHFTIAVALGAAAFLTRSFSIALLGAMGIHMLLRQRYRFTLVFGASIAAVVIPWIVWSWTARTFYSSYPTEIAINYADYFSSYSVTNSIFPFYRSLPINFGSIIVNWADFVFPWAPPLIGGVIVIMVVYFFARNFRQQPRLQDLYCALSFLIILTWPWPLTDRFLIVISPFLILYFFAGIRLIMSKLLTNYWSKEVAGRTSHAALIVVVSGALFHNFSTYHNYQEASRKMLPIYSEFHTMLAWIKDNTPIKATVVGHDDPAYYLFAGRKAIRISYPIPLSVANAKETGQEFPRPGKLFEWFKQMDACYISQNPIIGGAQKIYFRSLIQAIKRHFPHSLLPVYVSRDKRFVIHKIKGCPQELADLSHQHRTGNMETKIP